MEERIKYYDGIRGIAALWVATVHFFAAFHWSGLKTGDISLSDLLKRLLLEGDFCVYIFWLLSGIVITYGFLKSPGSMEQQVSRFPIKRYLRLGLPVFFSSLFCFLLLKYDFFYFRQLPGSPVYGGNEEWLGRFYNFQPDFLRFLKITFFDVYLIGNCNYNQPLWTIAPELFGPIIIAFLLWVYHSNRNRLLLYSILALFLLIGGMSSFSFYYYLFFIIGLMMMESEYPGHDGIKVRFLSVCQFLFNSLALAWALLALSVALEYLYQERLSHYFGFFRVPLRAVSFILIIKNTAALRKLLSIEPFQFLGKISFAVYLLHLPLILSVLSYIYLMSPHFFSNNVYVLFLVFLMVTIAFSYLFYYFIELPSIRFAKRISAKV